VPKKKPTGGDPEGFISCYGDEEEQSFTLSLYWWVTYTVTIRRHQLEALHRVIGRALKKGKKKPCAN
jgi:hypothetical protein